MAETEPMSSSSSMALPPLPPTFAGAPGQQQPYDSGISNGQGNPAHMPPPPLPPVVIPQNTNPIPTAMTSPTIDANGMMSPGSATSSFIRRAAPEPNKRALYVGGLDPRVTEDVLRQIFETTGHVQNVKIIPDKNVGAVSINLFCLSPCNRVLSTYRRYLDSCGLCKRKLFLLIGLEKRASIRQADRRLLVLNFAQSKKQHHTLLLLNLLLLLSRLFVADLPWFRVKVSITVSLNTTIQEQQNAPCRL